jgi:hypothetical protein
MGDTSVPAKTTTKPKHKTEKTSTVKETAETKTVKGGTTVVTIAKATVAKGNGTHDNIYEDAVKEIVALSENDTYAKKIDNGPLSEARGKDTWRLHSQLRAVDQLDKNVTNHVTTLQGALHEIDQHLHEDTVAVTNLVSTTRSDVQNWITSTHGEVGDWVSDAKSTLSGDIEKLTSTVKENFSKLAQATAGSEENLRSQTDSFSKAVENLLSSLQHEFDKKITAFQDEATRLIDKRFNQSDVAFAAIRADQEVIKALLTDIIKDRLGRPEPRSR